MTSFVAEGMWETGNTKEAIPLAETPTTVRGGAKILGERDVQERQEATASHIRAFPAVNFGKVALCLWRIWLAAAVTALVVINLMQPRFPGDLKSLMSGMQQPPGGVPAFGSGMMPGGAGFPTGGANPARGFGPFANGR